MTTKMHSSVEVEKILSGINYPTNKQNLINHVKSKNASKEVLSSMNSLPSREYTNGIDVSNELGGDENKADSEMNEKDGMEENDR